MSHLAPGSDAPASDAPRSDASGADPQPLLREGYWFAADRRGGADAFQTRLMGRRATVVGGRDGALLLYDESRLRRRDALPGPVQNTLFGKGAVHGLDDAEHRHRKGMFLSLLTPEAAEAIAGLAACRWDELIHATGPDARVCLLINVRDGLTWHGIRFRRGQLVLLDVYGTLHDTSVWPEPDRFDPDRFAGRDPDPFTLILQGGGDPAAGHRCPGERVAIELIKTPARLLSQARYELPPQDLRVSTSRMPTRPRSGVVITGLRRASERQPATTPAREASARTDDGPPSRR